MRIFTEQTLKRFSEDYPESKTAIQEWIKIVKKADWNNFADVKNTFNTVDSVGNGRFVFDIKGNDFRIVAIIRFTIKFIYIRFVGTHKQYDNIKDIKNI